MNDTTKKILKEVLPYIVIAVIIAIVVKKITGLFSSSESENKEEMSKDYVLKVKQEGVNASKLTQPLAAYTAMASAIYSAVKGLGTDEEAIKTVFKKLKTNDDFRQLVLSFNVRDGLDMLQWLYDDLPEGTGSDFVDEYIIGTAWNKNLSIGMLNNIMKANGLTIKI